MTNRPVRGLPRERSPAAVLIIDMLSDFAFPDGAAVARAARRIAPAIARLKARAAAAGVACLYVNDDAGRWRSDSRALIEHCLRPRSRGREVVQILQPGERDYIVLKPRHSAFYGTPLPVLLEHLGTQRLVITGVSAHQCVLFSANDAHLRRFELAVPRDCVASANARDERFALKYFESVLGADVRSGTALDLARLGRAK